MPYSEEEGCLKKRLGIDFGLYNTVIAINKGAGEKIRTVEFSGWSRQYPLERENSTVAVIPSLIHYNDDGSIIIGEQVFSQKCHDSPATGRWMKQYICQNNPAQFPAGRERMIGFRQAATDYLRLLLSSASMGSHKETREICDIIFTFPVDAPQGYTTWLEEVAESAGFGTCCMIDEAHAAVLGYGLNPLPGCKVLIIEFGQDGLDVKVVTIGEDIPNPAKSRSRILGRACDDFGGLRIDTCILQDLRLRNLSHESDAAIRRVHSALLCAISRVRETISSGGEGTVHITDPVSGKSITVTVRYSDLVRILDAQGIFTMLNRTLDRALAAAQMRGCEEDQISAVLMIGECSTLSPVKDAVKQRFFKKPVLHDLPVDAVARGAALYTSPVIQPDCIRNDYALRYWDPASQEHRFRFLVRNGARYPSAGQIARIIISASYDSQTRMGIPIYEIVRGVTDSNQCNIELISDTGGGMRIAGPVPDADTARKPEWVNEQAPTILVASPPAQKGEPRFELTFTIDRKRNLCVTARDIITGMLLKADAPLFRMT